MAESSVPTRLHSRPSFGTLGTRVKVQTNYFEVSFRPASPFLYHYNVSVISSGKVSPKIIRVVYSTMIEQHPDIFRDVSLAFDGRANLITSVELPFKERVFSEINISQSKAARPALFDLNIKFAAAVDSTKLFDFLSGKDLTRPQQVFQALEIAKAELPSKLYQNLAGCFFPQLEPRSIGGGVEVWQGFRPTFRPSLGKLFLNVDTAIKAFIEPQPLIRMVQDLCGRDFDKFSSSGMPPNLAKKLKGLFVEVKHLSRGRKFRINGVSSQSARTHKFVVEGQGETSVVNYFKSKYSISLKFPDLNLLEVGSSAKPILLPIEICHLISGQQYKKKLSSEQTRNMLRIANQKPNERMSAIRRGVERLGNDEVSKQFGIQVSDKPTEVDARVLPPPDLWFKDMYTVAPNRGQWRGDRFFESRNIAKWGFIVLAQEHRLSTRDVGGFINNFIRGSQDCGIRVDDSRPPIQYVDDRRRDDLEKMIVDFTRRHRFDILFFVVSGQDSFIYGEIKRVCETVLGLPSQVMLAQHVKNAKMPYIKNILLKINVKLGGINSVIKRGSPESIIMDVPTIIIGADVSHPEKGSTSSSIAAVVGSMDQFAYRYFPSVRAQNSRSEIIEDLGSMITEILKAFYKSTGGKKPRRILFYRDGVSEGQFETVLAHELNAIKKACLDLEDGYLPAVTFITVQKRHSTRLFPVGATGSDRSGNVLPGTVVDSGITHPYAFDFFLVSHAGIQGTSRPVHYYVLYDENKFDADVMQDFTNRLCYNFARCTRSVSICTPVYYADLLAYRARFHTRSRDDYSVSSDGSGRDLVLDPLPAQFRNSMFFV